LILDPIHSQQPPDISLGKPLKTSIYDSPILPIPALFQPGIGHIADLINAESEKAKPFTGSKVEWVKGYRELSGGSLKDAVDEYDLSKAGIHPKEHWEIKTGARAKREDEIAMALQLTIKSFVDAYMAHRYPTKPENVETAERAAIRWIANLLSSGEIEAARLIATSMVKGWE
jgi:hypothetical protein